ncbi:S9 family peptidase [Candidatus Thorarchaeota archaeon]|nr:MAG: S9 family peptidase [Candidatus Thorarchaeota archaeon]
MPQPPAARKEPHETEIHGIVLKDDYFWLRNKDSQDVLEYLQAENEYTVQMMRETEKLQEQLFEEMKSRIREDDQSTPIRYGDFYYYYREMKGKNYKVHCRKKGSLEAPEEVILDENVLAEGQKYLGIGSLRISNDQTLLAYTADFSGDETYEAHIVSLLTGGTVDRIEKTGARLEWAGDDSALFYTELDDIHRDYAVSRHVLRTEQGEDKRIFKEDDTRFEVQMRRSADGRYLFVYSENSPSETIEVRYLDLEEEEQTLSMLFSRDMGSEFLVEHHDESFYFLTDHKTHTRFRLMRTPIGHLEEDGWQHVTERRFETRIPGLVVFRDHLVVLSRSEGYGILTVHDLSSGEEHDIQFPEDIYDIRLSLGRFSHVFYFGNPEYDTETLRFYFSSPITPQTSYDYNMATRELQLKKRDEIKDYDPSQYTTERKHARAADGTRIPISMAYRRNTKLDGSSPLLLYGYGSYGYPVDPSFDHKLLSLLDRGMIFTIAHIRGGGEFGKRWYHQGKLQHKMNTFTDFIACAEYLIRENYTTSDRLCAWGGSAGGLLMGAIVNLRPDLFRCVVASVPFVDVINTMLDDTIPLTTFEYSEWGDPRIEEQFEWMLEYSPYDNVEMKEYPPILITAGYNDPRVQYWEPAKWTARLRRRKTDSNRLLLKTKMETGHFSSSGRYDYMKDYAFNYAYVLDTLGLVDP